MKWTTNPTGYIELYKYAASKGHGSLEDYYPASAHDQHEYDEDDLYPGKNVTWVGIPGKMLQIKAEYVEATPGNPIESNKLSALISGIRTKHKRLVFDAPSGYVSKIDLRSVKESLAEDPVAIRLTTGDDELDRYLIEGKDFIIEDYGCNPDENPDEFNKQVEEFELLLKEAEDKETGDLGEWTVRLRDGNHRAFGSIIAGEPYIWIKVDNNQVNYARQHATADYTELDELLA